MIHDRDEMQWACFGGTLRGLCRVGARQLTSEMDEMLCSQTALPLGIGNRR
jgi:hypothetical protein